MKRSSLYLFAGLLLVLVACGGAKPVATENTLQPEWITKTPINPNQYIGIGRAAKTNPNYRDIALKAALTEIANSISVTVSSTNLMQVFQYDNSFSDYFSMNSKISSASFLEGYQIEATHETESFYHVYVALSKQKHQESKQNRIKKAFETSKFKYEYALEAQKSKKNQEAFAAQIEAIDAIAPYLNEDLRYTENGKEVPYPSLLLRNFQDASKTISIQVPQRPFVITHAKDAAEIVLPKFAIQLGTKPLANFPVEVVFSWKPGNKEIFFTAADGTLQLNIPRACSANLEENISLKPALSKWIGTLTQNELLKKMAEKQQVNSERYPIQKKMPQVEIQVKSEEHPSTQSQLKEQIQQALLASNFSIGTAQKKDYTLSLVLNKDRNLQVNDKMALVFSCQIQVQKSNGTVIYSDSVTENTGFGATETQATNNAMESLVAKMKMKNLCDIMELML